MPGSNLYRRKGRWKIALLTIAAGIVLATVAYTNHLARAIKKEERRKVEQLADALEYVVSAPQEGDFTFVVELLRADHEIPLVVVDQAGDVIQSRNVDSVRMQDPAYRDRRLDRMRNHAEPIVIDLGEDVVQYLYYDNSRIYTQVRWFPVLQLSIIGAFLAVSYLVFSTSRRAEQNRVWVGMAKETAHQLGTPITSLVSWVEYLKEQEPPESLRGPLEEMASDIRRLELIAERFSKVGSAPDLQPYDLDGVLRHMIEYIRRRASRKVEFRFVPPEDPLHARINPPLFEWVLENLLKNALDAMDGSGIIEVRLIDGGKELFVDISDTGKGIPKSRFQTIFEPGYSTKKRGWGLGLTLVKRIVESYHDGRIFVKNSTPDQGTTFRIVLPSA